jgi:hypothetical protein
MDRQLAKKHAGATHTDFNTDQASHQPLEIGDLAH